MRAWLPVAALLLLPLVAGAASAQSGDVKIAVDPSSLVVEPGHTAKVNLTVYNPTKRDLALEIAAKPTNSTSIRVALSPTQVRVAAGRSAHVAAAIEVPRDVPPGTQSIQFGARETSATSPSGVAGAASTTTLDLRVASPTAAKLAPAAPTLARAVPTPKPTPSPDPTPATTEAATQMLAEPSSASSLPAMVAVGTAAAGSAGVGVLAIRKRWGAALLAPLYTRLARNRVLDQPTRQRVADLVTAEPGITFGEIARRLDLGAGTLTHHARMLEDAGVVFSSPDGQARRFFPVGGGRVAPVPPLAERALAELVSGPATLSDLAARLQVSKQALHYHVKKLAARNMISVRREGAELVLEETCAEGARPRARSA